MAQTQNLDPKVLDKVARLELRARRVVEGFVSGMHKSPYRGFSVEFAQHREYVPGDDIRYIDWKIFGKSDRFYIKEFEEETNLRAWLFLDQSESMAYGADDEGGESKFDYASAALAAIAFLIQQQSDAVGLTLFDEQVVKQIPPSNTRANLGLILQQIAEASPNAKTKVGPVLTEVAASLRKRGMVMVFSDLFDAPDQVLSGLRALAQRGHDVVVFHVFHSHEVEFPFERMTLFDGMEAMPELLVDPKSLRDAYLQEVDSFCDRIRRGCLAQRIDYVRLLTSQPLDVALSSYLTARASRAKRRK